MCLSWLSCGRELRSVGVLEVLPDCLVECIVNIVRRNILVCVIWHFCFIPFLLRFIDCAC